MNAIRKGVWVALLTITILPVVALAQLNTLDSLVAHYLEQRPEMAPLIPPLQPAVLKTIETMIRKSDYSFQDWEDWYAGWGESSWSAEGELADYSGQTLLVYEDLSEAAIQIVTSDGKLVATYESEPFPDFSTLTRTAADNAFLGELNLRSIMFWVSIENESAASTHAAAASPSVMSGLSGGGMAMMSMGGSNNLEVVEIGQTNADMVVTFAWPATFTNRVDIYSFDGGEFTGRVSWTLADVGYVTAATNQLRWIDAGQLGRALPGETGVRFYAAGAGAEVDADDDGYGDSYEFLVLHTSTNDPDTDNDLISDGPFDPDNAGSIVSGPDAFPFDPNEWLDTDSDGIGDNSDPDIDGDGIPNGSDPEPLTAGITAPFKVCSVISTNPAGSDAGDEQFDISSAGRMLPYAVGGNAISGFGRIHGGIYLNHDGTNLYIGVAGYSKTEITDGEDALLIVLDTKSGGVSGLNAISSGPKGLRICDNLLFQAGTFEPDVGILVGNRNSDGRNEPTAQIGGKEYGQGVYLLAGNVATNMTPAFTESGDSPISQWGDTPYSTNLANAGIEIAIPLSNLLDNAWSPSTTTAIYAAAIVLGNDNGTQRWLSSEAYGASVSGSFGNNNTTLLGTRVYLSPIPAPEPSTAPLFDDGEVMIQSFGWDVPRPVATYFNSMSVVGTFNSWNPAANNMTAIGDDTWEYIHIFTNASSVAFKFAANGDWSNQWGENNQSDFTLPINGSYAEYNVDNIVISNTLNGSVRFRFNNGSQIYSVEAVTNGTPATLLSGYSDMYWYARLQQEVESNLYARFDRVWMNPPQKGRSGKYSVGYDVFDPYDLGSYNQKGTISTRYGSEAQLKACYQAFAQKGIDCIVDTVLNHMNNSEVSNRYDYVYSHRTFEKRNISSGDTNGFFNVDYTDYPFRYDFGFGLPAGTNAWDAYPGAHSADVNERNPYMRSGMKNNGNWLQAKLGAHGCRFDYTQGMGPDFFAEYMRSSLMRDRFAVGEYWAVVKDASAREHQTWIALMDNRVCTYDFPLHDKLERMCNYPSTFNMEELSYGALIHAYPDRAVTFVESHDEIRPYGGNDEDKMGVIQKKELAYAFILMSEGQPCVFRQDYLDAPYADPNPQNDPIDDGWTGSPLTSLIDPLIDARKKYAGGTTTYLSTAYKTNLFIAKREGTESKDGCIFVINNHLSQTLTNSVNTGWTQGTVLVDALNTNHAVTVQSDGMAPLSASNRFYRVYVRQSAL